MIATAVAWAAAHRILLAVTLGVLTMAPIAVTALLKSLRTHGSRSSVLSPLLWLALVLVAFVLGCVSMGAPVWITLPVGLLFVGDVALIFWTYVHFLRIGQPHQLRSESYSLHQQLIEKGLIGDSTAGFIEADLGGSELVLEASESRGSLPAKTGATND